MSVHGRALTGSELRVLRRSVAGGADSDSESDSRSRSGRGACRHSLALSGGLAWIRPLATAAAREWGPPRRVVATLAAGGTVTGRCHKTVLQLEAEGHGPLLVAAA